MRRFSRSVLVALASVLLVSIGIGVGIYAADGGSGRAEPKVIISKPVAFDGHVPADTSDELSVNAARGFNRAAVKAAREIATPQTIANVFEVTQAMAELKR